MGTGLENVHVLLLFENAQQASYVAPRSLSFQKVNLSFALCCFAFNTPTFLLWKSIEHIRNFLLTLINEFSIKHPFFQYCVRVMSICYPPYKPVVGQPPVPPLGQPTTLSISTERLGMNDQGAGMIGTIFHIPLEQSCPVEMQFN